VKKRIILLVFIGIFIGNMFLFKENINSVAIQNENDANCVMNCVLNSNSTEVNQSLICNGSYEFFENTKFDISNASFSNSRIDVNNIQYQFSNNSNIVNGNFSNNIYNFSNNKVNLTDFYTSDNLDCRLELEINYNSNHTHLYYSDVYHDVHSESDYPMDCYKLDNYWYITDDDNGKVYRYDLNWNYDKEVADLGNDARGIEYIDGNWYISTRNSKRIYKYSMNDNLEWNYESYFSIDDGGNFYENMCWNGTYFNVVDYLSKEIDVYHLDGTYINSWSISDLPANPHSITSDNERFYITYEYNSDMWIRVYNGNWKYLNQEYNMDDLTGIADYSYGMYFDLENNTLYRVVWGTNDKILQLYKSDFISNITLNNFTYQELGNNYSNSFNMSIDYSKIIYHSFTNHTKVFYINSSMFYNWSKLHDLYVPSQLLDFTFYNSSFYVLNIVGNYSMFIRFYSKIWKIPSEVDFMLNDFTIFDNSYNSGIVFLDDFYDYLNFTSNIEIYFEFNITIEFNFEIELNIVSNTYLYLIFKLISNHQIYIDNIIFDIDLELYKVYFNSLLKTIYNNSRIVPNIYMDFGNIFYIHVILDDNIYRQLYQLNFTQIDNNYRTDSNVVNFESYFNSNYSFQYWNYYNQYNLISAELEYNLEIIDDFTNEGYFYYFEKNIVENSLIKGTFEINPNWDISYTILENTGIFAKIKVLYKADLSINNVSIILDLSVDNLYADNWDNNASQSSNNLVLEIPYVNFTNNYQTITLTGISDIPYASIVSYESESIYNVITMNNDINFIGFLDYSKYSQSFLINKEKEWNAYNVYYGNESYGIENISDTIVKVDGAGFNPQINNSYLHFSTKPFSLVELNFTGNEILITIESTLNVSFVYFRYSFNLEQEHTLSINNTDVYGLSDTDGYLVFYLDNIEKGILYLKIEINYTTIFEIIITSIIIFSVAGAFIGIYYYLKRNEKVYDNITGFVKKNVVDKLKKATDDKVVNDIEIEFQKKGIKIKSVK